MSWDAPCPTHTFVDEHLPCGEWGQRRTCYDGEATQNSVSILLRNVGPAPGGGKGDEAEAAEPQAAGCAVATRARDGRAWLVALGVALALSIRRRRSR
jgi:MYXO-CTERM domain-containing protein